MPHYASPRASANHTGACRSPSPNSQTWIKRDHAGDATGHLSQIREIVPRNKTPHTRESGGWGHCSSSSGGRTGGGEGCAARGGRRGLHRRSFAFLGQVRPGAASNHVHEAAERRMWLHSTTQPKLFSISSSQHLALTMNMSSLALPYGQGYRSQRTWEILKTAEG